MLTTPDPAAAARLRQFFDEAGYTEEVLGTRLDTLDPPLPQLRNLPRLLEITGEADRLNLLARWFFVGVAVEAATAQAHLPGDILDLLLDGGLLVREGDSLIPKVQLLPFQNLLLASDFNRDLDSPDSFEHVLPISPTVRHLLRFMVRTPVDTTLDLGTGCGVLALVAATFSREVVATDLNPRSGQFVAFNARLNGLDNIRFVAGDCFAPVAGLQFDLIVSNPPFVLAPSQTFLYRDSGMELDGFCQRLIREAPDLLEEGGRFQMIFEWVRIGQQSWQERLTEWFAGNRCDAWVLKDYSQEPSRYALTRLREMPPGTFESDQDIYHQWLEYYRQHGVSEIQGGILTLRRRTHTDHWVMLESLPGDVSWPVHQEIEHGLEARDLLADGGDPALLASRLQLRADTILERITRPVDGHWQPARFVLKNGDGFPHRMGVMENIADFLVRFDGRRSTGELIEELAEQVSTPARQVQAEALKVVRRMLLAGFLRIIA